MSDSETNHLTIGQMAERMAEPGIPATYIAGQLRGYAQADLIHNFGKVHGSGRTAHRLYTEPMMAQAKLLSVLVTDFGFADPEIMQATARACFSRELSEAEVQATVQLQKSGKEIAFVTPMQAAISDFNRGGWPSFELALLRHDQTGERKVVAQVVASGLKRIPIGDQTKNPDGFIPRGAVVIYLAPHFLRLFGERAKSN